MQRAWCGAVMVAMLLSACQVISPILVDYNGVRRDVAEWINGQTLLTMQQKRSLAQLSRAEQSLARAETMTDENAKLALAKTRQSALHCARLSVSETKITQLQQQVWGAEREQMLQYYAQQFPRIKLDANSIKCD